MIVALLADSSSMAAGKSSSVTSSGSSFESAHEAQYSPFYLNRLSST